MRHGDGNMRRNKRWKQSDTLWLNYVSIRKKNVFHKLRTNSYVSTLFLLYPTSWEMDGKIASIVWIVAISKENWIKNNLEIWKNLFKSNVLVVLFWKYVMNVCVQKRLNKKSKNLWNHWWKRKGFDDDKINEQNSHRLYDTVRNRATSWGPTFLYDNGKCAVRQGPFTMA